MTTYAAVKYLIVFLFYSILPVANAYVDPGSGSYLVQIVLGSIAAAVLFVRSHWLAIKNFFLGLLKTKIKTKNKKDPL